MSNKKSLQNRDGFRSRWGFTLACIGSAVGMGNIWRFPIMVSQYGGMTFLLPYFLFVFLISSTGVIGEFALGRTAGAGPIGAFGYCTGQRTGKKRPGEMVGFLPVVGSLMLAIGYTVVVGWIFKYTFMALSGGLYGLGADMNAIVDTFNAAAPGSDSLPQAVGMMVSGGLFNVSNSAWQIVGLVVSLAIIAMGIAGGIEKANKIMMPVLFFLFVVLGVYIFFLPGSGAGYSYIFRLSPAGLLDWKVWIFAFGQAFFSLSVAGNGSVIYGSYLGKNEDLVASARNVAVFDTMAALLAAFVIIPAMAAGGGDLSTSGPGLMFIYLVNVFNAMPGGQVVGMVFFVCVLFAGVTSLINLYETPVAALQERLGFKRLPAVALIGLLGCLVSLLIQPWTSQWMDMVSIYICPLGAMLAGIMFFWVLQEEKGRAAVNEGARKPVSETFFVLGRFVYVPLALIALIAGAVLGGIG